MTCLNNGNYFIEDTNEFNYIENQIEDLINNFYIDLFKLDQIILNLHINLFENGYFIIY